MTQVFENTQYCFWSYHSITRSSAFCLWIWLFTKTYRRTHTYQHLLESHSKCKKCSAISISWNSMASLGCEKFEFVGLGPVGLAIRPRCTFGTSTSSEKDSLAMDTMHQSYYDIQVMENSLPDSRHICSSLSTNDCSLEKVKSPSLSPRFMV